MLVDGAEVGVVDGLSQSAMQLSLALQCHPQRAVGTLVVAECHVDVAQSVERHHAVLSCGRRGVGALLAEFQGAVVIFLSDIQHPHPPVVGADVVQGLHPFQRVAESFCLPQPLAVGAKRLLEAALVAQPPAQFPKRDDAAEPVPLTLQPLLQHRKRV